MSSFTGMGKISGELWFCGTNFELITEIPEQHIHDFSILYSADHKIVLILTRSSQRNGQMLFFIDQVKVHVCSQLVIMTISL